MRLIEHTPKRWEDFIRSRNPIPESIIPLNPRKGRHWARVGTETLLAHARWAIADLGVNGRKELEKADPGLYQVLRIRGLLDQVGLGRSRREMRDWAKMSDEELIGFTRFFIAENGIEGRQELNEADRGLYQALRKRMLVDKVGLEHKLRDWAAMSDDEIVGLAKGSIAEKGMKGRKELKTADTGLYEALRIRKLLDRVGLGNTNSGYRDWAARPKEELVGFTIAFIVESGITRRSELKKADEGLYEVLRRRKLLDDIGLDDLRGERRDWAKMGRRRLVEYAKAFISESEITGRAELEKADQGLYLALRKRKLLDNAFSDVDHQKHADAVQGVMDALESFGDDS